MSVGVFFVLFYCINAVLMQGPGSGKDGNLRLCIVEGRGSYKRAPKYCPILDREKSGVECVLGTDRVDCLRRISKGTVDFGVFSPEDLVAAQWADIDVLVTNELKFTTKKFARDIVAVVNKRILPDSSASLHGILKNSTLCHPGVGLDDIHPLSDTISGYLESLVLERSCNASLTFTENHLKTLTDFYGKACKAGPWVPDKEEDARLKREYPSLCAACGSPTICSHTDRYWGDMGSLYCLSESAGDVSWGELNDVIRFFELQGNSTSSLSENFAFLCRDGTWRGMKEEPCVWLNRPWEVIVAKRKAAEAVSKLTHSIVDPVVGENPSRSALMGLLELRQALPLPLQPAQTPLDFLARAQGFREAYSQAGCDPPRHITLCTTSLLAKNKCEWMSESGAVYGIEPPLQCVARNSTADCLAAVAAGDSDVALADSDWLISGIRDYPLRPLLHEITPIVEHLSTVVAYVNTDSKIIKMADLRGKRAAFPRFDGTAWHSVKQYIVQKEKITCKQFMDGYFSEICAPGLDGRKCYEAGEGEALKSLFDGKSDVAFVSMKTYNMFRGKEPIPSEIKKIVPICPEDNTKYCFISWSNIGHIFAAKNLTEIRQHEIVNVFTKLDQIFGKRPPFHSPMFSMYGPYNHEMDVLFHNNTRNLATEHVLRTHPYDKIPHNFELMIGNITEFSCSFGERISPSLAWLITLVVLIFVS